jgi:hypothetical protein
MCVCVLQLLYPPACACVWCVLVVVRALCVYRSSRDAHSASLVQTLVGHTSWVLAVDSSIDGVHIATGYVIATWRMGRGGGKEGKGAVSGFWAWKA